MTQITPKSRGNLPEFPTHHCFSPLAKGANKTTQVMATLGRENAENLDFVFILDGFQILQQGTF